MQPRACSNKSSRWSGQSQTETSDSNGQCCRLWPTAPVEFLCGEGICSASLWSILPHSQCHRWASLNAGFVWLTVIVRFFHGSLFCQQLLPAGIWLVSVRVRHHCELWEVMLSYHEPSSPTAPVALPVNFWGFTVISNLPCCSNMKTGWFLPFWAFPPARQEWFPWWPWSRGFPSGIKQAVAV